MRYLPLSPTEREDMLARMGLAHIDDLFADAGDKLLTTPLDLPRRKSELAVERALGAMAAKNFPRAPRRSSSARGPTGTTCPRAWTI